MCGAPWRRDVAFRLLERGSRTLAAVAKQLGRPQTRLSLYRRTSTSLRHERTSVAREKKTQSDLPVRPSGEWKPIESVPLKAAKTALSKASSEIAGRSPERAAQLTRQERSIGDLLDVLPAAIYTTDPAGRITYYNQAAAELAGRRPVLGKDEWCVTWRLYWPDGRPLAHEDCPMALALKEDRAIRGVEALAERPDGTRVPFLPFPTPLHDESGALIGAVNMLVDISERKRAEESLREREQALTRAHVELEQRAAELVRFNQAAVGRELRIIELKEEVNAMCDRLGEPRRFPLEFEREPPSATAPSRSVRDAVAPLDSILRTEQLRVRPSRPPDHNAENQALIVLVQALADSPRTILQTLAEKVLEVLRAGSAGLSLLAPDRERFYWAAIAGQWSPHLGGGTPRDFGPCGEVLDRDAALLFTHWEHRYPYLADATPLAEEALLVPFHVAGKAVGTIWVIAHDAHRRFDAEDLRQLESLGRFASAAYQAVEFLSLVDQRRAALNLLEDAVQARQLAESSNRKLQESEEALREADRRKSEFLALLGHELRNPLAPIRNGGEILARTLKADARTKATIDMIKRQAEQLTHLVDDLLDVGRITHGRIDLNRRPLEISSVIAQAFETVEPLLREKEHRVSLLSSYQPLYVNGDAARLVQCVVNLLTNAAKYTDPRGEIRVQTRAEDSSAIIEIADTGTGIAPELLPRVFDLFVQSARTLDRAQGGLGVGLAVVKRLIEMHEGQVSARSAGVGQGSTFEIRLQRIARPSMAKAEAAPFKAERRRVLIVDDNADAANSLAMLLGLSGHETQVAYTGPEALQRLGSFQADVTLIDLGLPNMDGYELAGRLRSIARSQGFRLIALTGYGQADDHQRTRATGFDDHLVKPVDLAALERALVGAT